MIKPKCIADIKKAQAELNKIVETGLTEFCNSVFEKHPEIKGLGWVQYVPSFNDGEPCTWCLNTDNLRIEWKDEEKIESYDGYPENTTPGEQETIDKVLTAFGEFLEAVGSAFHSLFGDNAEVTVTKKEITVEEYEEPY